jgi:ABC-2 type transport system permease protein
VNGFLPALAPVVRKELRAYFLSPIALIFVATFLLAGLFSFFWIEGFFARGVADIRPLFTWLPVLLVFLVPALGMRLWSEEERTGTLELLRTLPLPARTLVVGKFLAGLALVAVALVLTLPVPITVEILGDLDWGPVIGGYLGVLLVAGTYLAITLCISASTPTQLVALVWGSVSCGALYAAGSDTVANLFGNAGGELLRALGAGSRFESILRGVVDLRDILYYGSLIFFFLALNTVLIQARAWSGSALGASRRTGAKLFIVLLGANLLCANLLASDVRGVRLDLTAGGEYSVSDVTRTQLAGLDEPVLIRGYFSAKTHPLLSPLVPRIRDLIEEYGAIGGDRIRAEFVDPTSDPELEKEADQAYGIKSVPFSFTDRHEASVVNSYFDVLVRCGDRYETLSFNDLIEVEVNGMDVSVRLRNLEYDLTRALRKVTTGFASLESVFARMPAEATLSAYIGGDLPEGFTDVGTVFDAVGEELAARSKGRFSHRRIDPTAPDAEVTEAQLAERYGLRPLTVSLFSQETFHYHLILQMGDRLERIVVDDPGSEADLKEAVIAALKRTGPGSLKTIGVVVGKEEAPPQQMPGMPPQPPGGLTFRALRRQLQQTYEVTDVDLAKGVVPGEVDVLLVLDPRNFGDVERYAFDQFLMRGGSAIVASGRYALDLSAARGGLALKRVDSGMNDLLEGYGARIGEGIVLDLESGSFPIPVVRDLGGFRIQEIQLQRYPAFADVRRDRMDRDNPAVAGLPSLLLHWTSPVDRVDTESDRSAVLFRSSDDAWIDTAYSAQPDPVHGELGWAMPEERTSYPLAVTLLGPFESGIPEGSAPDLPDAPKATRLAASPDRSRLVVIGSGNFVADPVLQIGRQGGDMARSNLELIQNLVDWAMEDVGLLRIRSRGAHARVLEPTDKDERRSYEWANYGFALLAVFGIGSATLGRRRRASPMPLDPPKEVA